MMAEKAQTAIPASIRSKRWPKHAVWLGLVVTSIGVLSYFLYFYQFPGLRDVPVVNLPIVLLGVTVAAVGCWGVFRQSSGALAKGLASLGFLLALGVAGVFHYYVFAMSYQLPESSEAPAVAEAAPDFTLLDHQGQKVKLSNYRGKKVVLVYYRGNW